MSNYLILFAALMGLAVNSATAEEPPRFKIVTKRKNDLVETKSEKSRLIFSIQSPEGISEATIERVGDRWPNAVVLRLSLKGLEDFWVTNGKVRLAAAVSSHDGKVRLWKDDQEDSPLDVTSLYWMEIRKVGNDGKPTATIPLNDGHFEMTLPKAFFAENPKSITVKWIDFFRN